MFFRVKERLEGCLRRVVQQQRHDCVRREGQRVFEKFPEVPSRRLFHHFRVGKAWDNPAQYRAKADGRLYAVCCLQLS